MDKKSLRVDLEVLNNVPDKILETAQYMKENMKEVYEREK